MSQGSRAALLGSLSDSVEDCRDLTSLLKRAPSTFSGEPMHPLEAELRSLLETQSGFSPVDAGGGEDEVPVGQPVRDYAAAIDAFPSATVADLRAVVKRMLAAGLGEECLRAYSTCRRDFLQESISRLGLRRRPSWPAGEEITRWVEVARVAVFILFPSERRLCNRVFAGLAAPVADLSLAETCRAPVRRLLAFPDAAAAGSRSPERLFGMMDIYEALRELVPEIAAVFFGEYSSFFVLQFAAAGARLAAAVRGIFAELENRIRRDPAAPPVASGGLHPMTRYVVNYLRAASRCRRTLEEIMNEDGGAAAGDQIVWAMDLLLDNLEAKSKSYRDPAQSFLFLLNNGWYIAQKVKDGELGVLLGEDWIRGQTASVRRWRSGYQRTTWGALIDLLDAGREASSRSSSPAPANSLGEKLQMFNELFGETYKNQAGWVAADEGLATELRASAIQLVLPAYQSFLTRLRSSPAPEKSPEKSPERLVKYSPADVKARINRLFKGSARNL